MKGRGKVKAEEKQKELTVAAHCSSIIELLLGFLNVNTFFSSIFLSLPPWRASSFTHVSCYNRETRYKTLAAQFLLAVSRCVCRASARSLARACVFARASDFLIFRAHASAACSRRNGIISASATDSNCLLYKGLWVTI